MVRCEFNCAEEKRKVEGIEKGPKVGDVAGSRVPRDCVGRLHLASRLCASASKHYLQSGNTNRADDVFLLSSIGDALGLTP